MHIHIEATQSGMSKHFSEASVASGTSAAARAPEAGPIAPIVAHTSACRPHCDDGAVGDKGYPDCPMLVSAPTDHCVQHIDTCPPVLASAGTQRALSDDS